MYVQKPLLSLPVSAVDTDTVRAVLEPIWTTKHETATRVRSRIEQVLEAELKRHGRLKAGDMSRIQADVVMLGVALLGSLGRDYAERYWQALVTSTGAMRVFPVHFEDQTRPFGEIVLPPKLIDNFVRTATWLQAIRDTWDRDTQLLLPSFGQRLALYPEQAPDA